MAKSGSPGVFNKRDSSGRLETLGSHIIKRYFKELVDEKIRMLYTWRHPSRIDEDGRTILGRATRLPNKLRDVFGYDFEVEISLEHWPNLPLSKQWRLMWHELRHCQIAHDSDDVGGVAKDNQDRIKIYCDPHDLVIQSFQDEIVAFGLTEDAKPTAKFLHRHYIKSKSGEQGDIDLNKEAKLFQKIMDRMTREGKVGPIPSAAPPDKPPKHSGPRRAKKSLQKPSFRTRRRT